MAGDLGNKQTRGKQKIAMKMIEEEDNCLITITFSKRRNGIFKKASEIVTLCGPEDVVVIFSPSGKPFSFGHPSLDVVIDKFMANNHKTPVDTTANNILQAFRCRKFEELNGLIDSLYERLEEEKALSKALKKKLNGTLTLYGRTQKRAMSEEDEEEKEDDDENKEDKKEKDKKQCWEVSLEGLAEDVLEEKYKYMSFQELHNKFSSHVKERIAKANNTCSGGNAAPPPPSREAGSCSGEGSDDPFVPGCGGVGWVVVVVLITCLGIRQ